MPSREHLPLSRSSCVGTAVQLRLHGVHIGNGGLCGAGSVAPGEPAQINPTTGTVTKVGSFGLGIGSSCDLGFLKGQLCGPMCTCTTGTQKYLAKSSLSESAMCGQSALAQTEGRYD